jgi:dTDP-glucose 4,6-dehydratase
MKILVTGGMGFIGSHFVEKMVAEGQEVVIWDNFTYAASTQNLSKEVASAVIIDRVDISDWSEVDRLSSRYPTFDVITNFAAESHVDRSIENPSKFFATNLIGTVNMLELYRRGYAGKFLQVSTDEVYGSIAHGSWEESAPLDPRSPYAASKAAADLACQAFSNTYNLPFLMTRSSNNFGARQSVEKLIPRAVANILAGRPIPIYGSGLQTREWIYVKDNVDLIAGILEQDKLDQSIFNIGGYELTNLELVKKLCALLSDFNPRIVHVEDRPGHDFRYSVDDSRVRSLIKNVKTPSFFDNLQTTVEWYLKNPGWIKMSEGLVSK